MKPEDVRQLIDGYLDQTLTREQIETLNALLADQPEVADQFLQAAEVDHLLSSNFSQAQMRQQASELIASLPIALQESSAKQTFFRQSLRRFQRLMSQPTPLSLTVAAVFLGLLITAMAFVAAPIYREITRSNAVTDPVAVAGVAGTIRYVHAAEFATGQVAIQVGDSLRVGDRLEVTTGIVEVTLNSGTGLVVEGPALVTLRSANSAVLDHGQIVAHVPPEAVGFQLTTTAAEVVDLGTSFGAACEEGARTVTVEVFQGEVELQFASGASSLRVTEGERVAVNSDGPMASDTSVGFARYAPGSPDEPPELVAFYTFEGDANDVSGNGHHATVVSNVEFVEGYEGQAARFVGSVNSYIDIPVNASTDAMPVMTWGAWVRPSEIGESYREILSTDDGGFDRVLTIDDRLRQGVGSKGPRFAAFGGVNMGVLPIYDPIPSNGEWTFVAAIYDEPKGQVALFVAHASPDGQAAKLMHQVFSKTSIGRSLTFVRIGMNARGVAEPFLGEIDNVFLFRGALTKEQLKSLQIEGPKLLSSF